MPMNGRELHEAIFRGERFDRLPVPDIHPWGETQERWVREGLPPDRNCNEVLGLWGNDGEGLPLDLNMVPKFEVRLIEKDAEYVVLVDEYGITKKILRADFDRSGGLMGEAGAMSSMSHWIDFPVKTLADWKPLYEERFRADLTGRLPANWAAYRPEWLQRCETRWVGYFCFPLGGLFGGLRQLLGLEGLIFAMADDPDLVHTMVDDLTDFWVAAFAKALDGARLDQITFFEDMCATKGPLLGPAMYREFLAPGYRKVIGELRAMGVSEFWVDSDGNFKPLIAEAMACGLTGMAPCEINSDMDPDELRAAFPKFNLAGGIDKRVLTRGPAEIEAEIRRRYTTAWRSGRYIPRLDHGAPPDIPWANAGHYARWVKHFCQESAGRTLGS